MNMNKARWFEYAVSSSFMLVVIAWLCGMFDFRVHNAAVLPERLHEPVRLHDGGAQPEHQEDRLDGVHLRLLRRPDTLDRALHVFHRGARRFPSRLRLWHHDLDRVLLQRVRHANMVLQYKKVGKWKDYLYGERFYIILSLVAKTALAWQVFSGTMVSQDQNPLPFSLFFRDGIPSISANAVPAFVKEHRDRTVTSAHQALASVRTRGFLLLDQTQQPLRSWKLLRCPRSPRSSGSWPGWRSPCAPRSGLSRDQAVPVKSTSSSGRK